MLITNLPIIIRMVKRSSPNLNYFIITGALIMYSSVYFHLVPSTDETVVQARCVVCALLVTINNKQKLLAIVSVNFMFVIK